jgi:ankyrin repeat protein
MNKITNFLCLSLLLLGATALGMNTPGKQLIEVAKIGDIEGVQRLLEQEVSVDTRDNCGRTPLMWAALNGHEDMCKLLIANKASVGVYEADGLNPLIFAILDGNKDVCKLLIANKASVEVEFSGRWVPLHYAACHGHKDVCRLLIENKASIDAKSRIGETPLHIAALHGRKDVCGLLIEHKASVDAKDNDGRPPLVVAAHNGYENACRLLIDVQLESARKAKAAIVTFLGIVKKRGKNLPCHMHYDVAKIIDRQAFEIVRQKNWSVIEQINQFNDQAKTRWLAYVNQQMNSVNK